jgi:hypothetical protein
MEFAFPASQPERRTYIRSQFLESLRALISGAACAWSQGLRPPRRTISAKLHSIRNIAPRLKPSLQLPVRPNSVVQRDPQPVLGKIVKLPYVPEIPKEAVDEILAGLSPDLNYKS